MHFNQTPPNPHTSANPPEADRRARGPGATTRNPVNRTLLIIFFALSAVAHAADDQGLSLMRLPFERGSQTPPAVSVFYDLGYGGIGSKQPHAVIACIWPDGRAVWSRDRSRGGPPYFTGRIDPKRLTELIATLDSKGIFARKVWYSVGVDAS